MPLGYENNGVSAGLIERGGDLLAESLINTGKTIEGALIRSQAFKQARELGAAIQQTNPQSDDWPQQAAFLVSQYPLAAQSGLAKMVMEPVGKAYAGYQAAKVAGLRIQGQKDIAAARTGVANPFTGGLTEPNGAPSPQLTNPNQDPIDVVGKIGAGGLGGAMQAPDLGQPASVLPPLPDGTNADTSLPDAATGMKRRIQRMSIESALNQVGRINAEAISKGQPPVFKTQAQVDAAAFKIKSAQDKLAAAEEKANAPAADFHPSTVVPGVMLTARGTPFVKTDTGVAHPSSEFAAKRIQDSEDRFAYRKEQDAKKQQNAAEALARKSEEQAAAAKVKSLQADMSRVQSALAQVRKFEYSDKPEERAQFTQRQREAQVVRDALAAAEKDHYEALKKAPKNEDLPVIEAPATKIMRDPATGKRYEVDPDSKKIIREVQ